jgi:hypothetical protein
MVLKKNWNQGQTSECEHNGTLGKTSDGETPFPSSNQYDLSYDMAISDKQRCSRQAEERILYSCEIPMEKLDNRFPIQIDFSVNATTFTTRGFIPKLRVES